MTVPHTTPPERSLYQRVGGAPFFERLVEVFYDAVASDEALVALYPDAPDLRRARRRLTLFLVQYWGGPATYSHERGDPRLRMRHLRFPIGPAERDRWLTHMTAAIEQVTVGLGDPGVADELLAYFRPTAEHLRNDTGLPITSPRFGR